ncbi:hypothetical protein MYX76_10405, partial [Desulfobacterota bacterium AH_259_B03_O07]|nr:hypothetical protein [Desulfobacterota bacterium AH_259_B03_O07]
QATSVPNSTSFCTTIITATCDGIECDAVGGAISEATLVNNSTLNSNFVTCNGDACDADGGAISGAPLVNNSTLNSNSVTCVDGNCEAFGGAISGAPLVNNSTLNSNSVTCGGDDCRAEGGAIWNGGGLVNIEVNNSTLNSNSASCSGNRCSELGASVTAGDGSLILDCSIFNTNTSIGNCTGSNNIRSLGNNIDNGTTCIGGNVTSDKPNTDPGLDPAGLQDNGGPTQTIALLPDSPAIDMCISTCPPPDTDQRGVLRPIDGDGDDVAICDIGAFELEEGFNNIPGDANADGFVNLADLGVIINAFRGTPAPGNGDCNEDGFTNLADLGCVITKFRG